MAGPGSAAIVAPSPNAVTERSGGGASSQAGNRPPWRRSATLLWQVG